MTVWQEAVLRQCERLQTDLISREVSVLFTCLLFSVYLPAPLLASIYAICVVTEFIQIAAYRAYRRHARMGWYALMLANSVFALAAFSVIGVLAWQNEQPLVRFAALIALVGALLNVSSARSTDLLFGALSGLPPAFSLLWIAGEELWRADGFGPGAFATISLTGFLGYFGSALYQNHRVQTNLARMSVAARAASDAKSRFLAEMSHEMRTPLNAILGLSQSLREDPAPRDLDVSARAIEEGARRLETLIADVLDLASSEEGALTSRPVTVAIRRELSAALVQPSQVPEAEADISVADEVPEFARLDPTMLRKLLRHLAERIAPPRSDGAPRVSLAAGLESGRPDRIALRLCAVQPLVLGAAAVPPRRPGDGRPGILGELVIDRLTRLMSADLAYEQSAGGARVAVLSVPFARVPDPPAPGAFASGRRLRVLVVDDIGTNRFVVAQLLRLLDIDAIEAEGGAAALNLLAVTPIDVALLDMNMPAMDGEATFRAIRGSGASFARVPVVAMTADTLAEHRERYLALGLDGYVPKPVDKRLLWAEIASVVGKEPARRPPPQ